MTEPATQPSYDKRKLWKLALLMVPAILSGVSSYAKSRAESTDESKATFEHMDADIDDLQDAMAKVIETNYAQQAEITMLKEQLEAANKRAEAARHWTAPPPGPVVVAKPPPTDFSDDAMDGVPEPRPAPAREPRHKSNFDAVVQSYKSKK